MKDDQMNQNSTPAQALDIVQTWIRRQPHSPDELSSQITICSINHQLISHLQVRTQYLTGEQFTTTTDITSTTNIIIETTPSDWIAYFQARKAFSNQSQTFLLYTTQQSEPCPVYINCGYCGGSGTNACGRCGGSGTIIGPWDEEKRTGYQPCSNCGSTGRIRCNSCGGGGSETCPKCWGSGTYTYSIYHGLTYHCRTTLHNELFHPALSSNQEVLQRIIKSYPISPRPSQEIFFTPTQRETLLNAIEPHIATQAYSLTSNAIQPNCGEVLFQQITITNYPLHQVMVQIGIEMRADTLWIYGKKNEVYWPTVPVDPTKVRKGTLTRLGLSMGIILLCGLFFFWWGTEQAAVIKIPQPTISPNATTVLSLSTTNESIILSPVASVTMVQTGVRLVQSDALNVRSTPDPDADNILTTLLRGNRVILTGRSVQIRKSTWVEITLADGRTGWVNLEFLEDA